MACRKAGVQIPKGRIQRARHRGLAAAARGLRLRLRAARPRRPADQRQRRHRRLQRDRLRLPDAAGLPRRDRRPLPRRRHRRVRPRRQRGRRRAGRAGDQAADAVDAREVLERPGRRALPRRVLRHATRASGARATGCRFSEQGTCVITGRSDATLNRGGVRMGTSELYAVVEEFAGGRGQPRRAPRGRRGRRRASSCCSSSPTSTTTCAGGSRARCARELSPRHVPDTIAAVPAIPRTLTGKKLEAPVKRILRGARGGYGRQPRRARRSRARSMLSCSSPRRGGGDDGRTASARAAADRQRGRCQTGAAILRSEMALEPYEASLGVLLRRWAEEAPDRVFLAERPGPDGDWVEPDLGRGRAARRTRSPRRCSTASLGPSGR